MALISEIRQRSQLTPKERAKEHEQACFKTGKSCNIAGRPVNIGSCMLEPLLAVLRSSLAKVRVCFAALVVPIRRIPPAWSGRSAAARRVPKRLYTGQS